MGTTPILCCPVLCLRRSSLYWALLCLLPLTSCANSSLGEALQKSFAADPKLTGTLAASPSPTATPPTPEPSIAPTGNLSNIPALPGDADVGTSRNSSQTEPTAGSAVPSTGQTTFSDLAQAPKELRSSVEAVAQLGILTPAKATASPNSTQFAPNKAITRREFAQWLVAANNQLNRDRPANQLRLGLKDAQPAFQDVPRTDPDFATIQGLAEAGILPSALSGDSTTVTFRPDAPLTREALVMWKVPLDTRQPLAAATIDAIKQTWGFQDASKVDARALRAVLADFQNGDLANIRRVYGFTTLFQPKKAVSRAEAAAALWYFGYQGEGSSAKDALKPATPAEQPSATGQQDASEQ